MTNISLAQTDNEILRCFPVTTELRPLLVEGEFIARVRRQQKQGYQLAFLEDAGAIKSVAGFRIGEFLCWGRTLYVDDLVTTKDGRSKGYGQKMFDWLLAYAREQGCDQFHLDSGVEKFAAHRFYLRNRMDLSCHHFGLKLR